MMIMQIIKKITESIYIPVNANTLKIPLRTFGNEPLKPQLLTLLEDTYTRSLHSVLTEIKVIEQYKLVFWLTTGAQESSITLLFQ